MPANDVGAGERFAAEDYFIPKAPIAAGVTPTHSFVLSCSRLFLQGFMNELKVGNKPARFEPSRLFIRRTKQ